MDRQTGERIGACCVYYPEGSTWDDAETVMYPSTATKGAGQRTLKEFMASDLDDFQQHNSGMSFEDGGELPLKHGRSAKIRYSITSITDRLRQWHISMRTKLLLLW